MKKIKIPKEQREYLLKYIPNLNDLIATDNIQLLLNAIDANNILDDNDEPDIAGIELQKIYNKAYNKN